MSVSGNCVISISAAKEPKPPFEPLQAAQHAHLVPLHVDLHEQVSIALVQSLG